MVTNTNLRSVNHFPFSLLCFLALNFSDKLLAQNIAINATGVVAATTNMFEVTQTSTAANMVALYAIHSGAAAGTGYGFQALKTGASTTNIAGYFSASGGTNNYALIVPSGGGNVGIGTTTPFGQVHINANAQASFLMSDTRTAGNQVGRIVYDGGTVVTGGGWVFQKMTDAGAFSANLVTIIQNTGNVGIGTLTPGATLEVAGNIKTTGSASSPGMWIGGNYTAVAGTSYGLLSRGTLTATANSDRLISIASNIGVVTPGAFTGVNFLAAEIDANSWTKSGGTIANAYGLAVYAPTIGTNNYAGVFTGGNVGIGTTTPNSTLHVMATAPSLAAGTGIVSISDNTALAADVGANLSFRGIYTATGATALFGGIKAGKTNATDGNLDGYLSLYSRSNAGGILERMRLDNAGNVGIGTTSPGAKLDVQSGGVGINIRTNYLDLHGDNGVTTDRPYFRGTTSHLVINGGGTTAGGDIYLNYTGDGTTGNVRIRENLFVMSTGNVGIGTTGPGGRLDVSGGYSAGAVAVPVGLAIAANGASPDRAQIWWGDNTGWKLHFGTRDAGGTFQSRVTFVDAGNVGIGTTIPDQKLNVLGYVHPGPPSTTNYAGANTDCGVNFTSVGTNGGAPQLVHPAGRIYGSYSGAGGWPGQQIVFEAANNWATYVTNQFVLKGDGNVGIGTGTPAYALQVVGAVYASGVAYCNGIALCSDFRYKKNVTPLPNALNNILKLEGIHYFWKANEFPDKHFTTDKQIGFIAQEIEKIYPELITTDKEGYKLVDYARLTPVLVEALKEQQKIIDTQKKEIESLNSRFGVMESSLKALQSQIIGSAKK